MRRKLAAMLSAALLLLSMSAHAAEAGRTTIKVLGTNGSVTVGIRHQYGQTHTDGAGTWRDAFQQDTMVYTTDGANWQTAHPGPMAQTCTDRGGTHTDIDAFEGRWDGERFLVWKYPGGRTPSYASTDGVHWTAWTGTADTACPRGVAQLGPYRFELDQNGDVWLMDGQSRGLRLPTLGRAEYMSPVNLQAYYGPDGSVVVDVYDMYTWDENGDWKNTAAFSTDSLDWCLENLARPRLPETGGDHWATSYTAGNGVILCQVEAGPAGMEYWTSTDGAAWTLQDGPWPGYGGNCDLLPFTGKTFAVLNGRTLTPYVSEDGVHWNGLEGTFLQSEKSGYPYSGRYGMVWTGDGYLTCRWVGEVYGSAANGWDPKWESPYNTKVTLCDQQFRETFSYDFGSGVDDVDVWNGVYYAKVQRPREDDFNARVIYSSTDGRQWTATELEDLPRETRGEGTSVEAGAYRLLLKEDGSLWVSTDGTAYGRLPDLPGVEESTDGIIVYQGRDGLLVLGTHTRPPWGGLGQSWEAYSYRNGSARGYTNKELSAAAAGLGA